MKKFVTSKYICLMLASFAGCGFAFAQTSEAADTVKSAAADTLAAVPRKNIRAVIASADSLRRNYEFERAVGLCREALEHPVDSSDKPALDEVLMLAQNGLNMLDYCSQPVVVARQRFPLKDFFLFYPLEDGGWKPIPNPLDSLADGKFPRAMYIPEGTSELFYSATDGEGIRNIYGSNLKNGVWGIPELLDEQLTSHSDEIFPMLSPDGNSLYFASKGLYGMGGYDLYVSNRNKRTGDWDMPVNLGFPFSSPGDDFLFMNTPDGKYSIFASNRDCSKDSVYIYVLEYDSMPVRKAVSEPEKVRVLSALRPVDDLSRIDNDSVVAGEIPENPEIDRYSDKMLQVRALRDSIQAYSRSIDDSRSLLAAATGEQKQSLEEEILQKEMLLPGLQASLSRAVKELQQIEMEFLSGGVVIDPGKVRKEADREVVGAASAYTFSRKSMGLPAEMKVLRPEPSFDYSFMILPEGRFAEDNTLPHGLVYQIQIFSSPSKATLKQIKGLSPVFEKTGTSMKYTYSVGVFRTYKDVLANLNKVKKAGFRSAFITAYSDGAQITIAKAKEIEGRTTPAKTQ